MKRALAIALTAAIILSFAACKHKNASVLPHGEETLEALADWIETVDAENYSAGGDAYKGQFKDFVTEIRNEEALFVPHYKRAIPYASDPAVPNVRLYPESADEERWIGYNLKIEGVPISVEFHYIDDAYKSIANRGFDAYLKSKRATMFTVPTTLENWKADPAVKNMYAEKYILNDLVDAPRTCRVTETNDGQFIIEFIMAPGYIRIRSNQNIAKSGLLQEILFREVDLKNIEDA